MFIKWMNHSEVFLVKGVLEICSKFTEEHPCRNVISIKLQSSFIEITLRCGCSPVNLLHIFRTHFYKDTYGGLLLTIISTNLVINLLLSLFCPFVETQTKNLMV